MGGRQGLAARAEADPLAFADSPRAWLVAVGAFLATFAVFGPTYSFGIFFDAMAEDFDASTGAVALVFSIATFCYFVGGILTGRLADRFGPRPVLAVGGAAMVLGLAVTATVNVLPMAYLTYGLGVGAGVAAGYVPMVAQLGGWFLRHRAPAMGLAVAGIGMAWVVVPPVVRWLIDSYGWRTSYVVLAVGVGVLLAAATALTARPPGSAGAEPPDMAAVVRTRSFSSLYLSAVLGSIALFMPFVYLVSYATEHGVSDTAAAWLLPVLGAVSVLSRLGMGAIGDRVGVNRLYRVTFSLMGLSAVIWLLAGSSYGAMVAFAVVLGVGYGGFIALSPAVVAHQFGVRGLGQILGASYTAAGIGGLVGPPIGGWLLDRTGSYTSTILFGLAAGAAAAVVLQWLPDEPEAMTG